MLFSGANLEQWLDDPAVTNAFYDLSDEASKKKGQGDFDKLFAKFLVDWNIPVAAGTAFLHACTESSVRSILPRCQGIRERWRR